MVAEGTFRQDLFYRLSGFAIQLPSLRERKDDIPTLIDYFIQLLGQELTNPIHQVSQQAMDILQQHTWPGNVRELFSAIRFAVVKSVGGVFTEDCLPPSCLGVAETGKRDDLSLSAPSGKGEIQQIVQRLLAGGSNDIYREVVHVVDAIIVEEVLKATGGNQLLAAERLGISRATLRSKNRAIASGDDE
jgi:two-component system nitrogen regulation response regulator GlnG